MNGWRAVPRAFFIPRLPHIGRTARALGGAARQRRCLFACLFAAALALGGEDAPTLDFTAGWGWSPYGYDRYPYGGPYWRDYPCAGLGLGVPLCRGERFGERYGYYGYGYDPFWSFDYRVRISLRDKRYLPVLSEGLLRPLPGSAPTELRDPERDRLWEQDLETLFGAGAASARQSSLTNAPPPAAPQPDSPR